MTNVLIQQRQDLVAYLLSQGLKPYTSKCLTTTTFSKYSDKGDLMISINNEQPEYWGVTYGGDYGETYEANDFDDVVSYIKHGDIQTSPIYQIDFRYNSEGSDLEILDDENEVVASFVCDRATKLFLFLMNFPSENERNIYINDRIGALIDLTV